MVDMIVEIKNNKHKVLYIFVLLALKSCIMGIKSQ